MNDPEVIRPCPNCGNTAVSTNYCPDCGQRRLSEKDTRISSLISDFFGSVLSLENSVLRTLKAFFIRPDHYAEKYEEGARKKYLSPIKLFLFANAVYFIFPAINAFTTTLEIQLSQLIYSELTRSFIEQRITASGLSFESFSTTYNELTATLSKVLLVILPVLFGCATWISNSRNPENSYFLFHLKRSLIFHSFILLIVVSLLPGFLFIIAREFQLQWLFDHFNNFNITAASVILMNLFGYLLYRGFFKSSLLINILRTFVLNGVYYLLIFIYRFILLMITLGWISAFK